MEYAVYILLDQRGKYYIGQTNDLVRRLSEHNDIERKSWAAKYGPWTVVHSEIFETRAESMSKERHLKSLKSKDSIEKYIAGWRNGTSRGS